ncbi:uncharacterized protein EV420DRAFT_417973 [Desarmillaria tabescens]|uniref:Uncharacterized protein n=1 Tax=Armillaria tabescens TaxID=1929756 RepID=A0AA39J2D2_ARMTA|nr:uncharacterized protein EV420DRAFT_417973 [Desarmillaria tabescens]KAK0434264.1 hypothetical protein EV420DRAFT_417973 [Desarmillaria tabescens]
MNSRRSPLHQAWRRHPLHPQNIHHYHGRQFLLSSRSICCCRRCLSQIPPIGTTFLPHAYLLTDVEKRSRSLFACAWRYGINERDGNIPTRTRQDGEFGGEVCVCGGGPGPPHEDVHRRSDGGRRCVWQSSATDGVRQPNFMYVNSEYTFWNGTATGVLFVNIIQATEIILQNVRKLVSITIQSENPAELETK